MTCSVTPLNEVQLQQLASNAGFNSTLAPIMAAIALAESGGCPTATNPNDNGGTQTSWGLWQISDGTHRQPSGWDNPQVNAQMAYTKYQTQGLKAWGTYTSGAYKQYIGTSASTSPQQTAQNALSNVPGLSGITSLFTNFSEEVAIFLIALVVIILGVYLLMHNQIEGVTHAHPVT